MNSGLAGLLSNKAVNGWNLFWLITTPISIAIVIAMTRVDLSSAENISSLIQFAVRCAVPLLYLAFAAASLHAVFPSLFSRWLLRNRKFIGLCFASAMAWQLLFILWLTGVHTQYYVEDVYVLSDAIEGVGGYLSLTAMVLTSFKFGRRHLSAKQWKFLHTFAIYYVWAYVWSVYWYALFYYDDPLPIDYIYYVAGLLAWALRLAAWSKKHWQQSAVLSRPLLLLVGIAAVAVSWSALLVDSPWSGQAFEFFAGNVVMESVGTFVPYFPFVPFFPIFIMMSGAFFIVRSRE